MSDSKLSISKANIKYRVWGYRILEATSTMTINLHGDYTGLLHIKRQLHLPSRFEWTMLEIAIERPHSHLPSVDLVFVMFSGPLFWQKPVSSVVLVTFTRKTMII